MILGYLFILVSGSKADRKSWNKWALLGRTLDVNLFIVSLGWAKLPKEDSSSFLPEFYRCSCQRLGTEQGKETTLVDFHSPLCLLLLSLDQELANFLLRAREYLCLYIFFSLKKKKTAKNVKALLNYQLCKNRLQGWTWPVSYTVCRPLAQMSNVVATSYMLQRST